MNLYELKLGDRVRTTEGAIAEVVSETEDGKWIRVCYVEGTEDLALIGTIDLCEEGEILELLTSEPERRRS